MSLRTLQEWENPRGKGNPPAYIVRALNDLAMERDQSTSPPPVIERNYDPEDYKYGVRPVEMDEPEVVTDFDFGA